MRVTQRAPLSCTRCGVKKIRCSKTVPCTTCITLGIADECQRETVTVAKRQRTRKPRASSRQLGDGNTEGSLNHNRERTGHIRRRIVTRDNSFENSSRIEYSRTEQQASPSIVDELETYSEPYDEIRHDYQMHREHGPSTAASNSVYSPTIGHKILPTQPESSSYNYEVNTLAENAASTLEFLAWGRQRDVGAFPISTMAPAKRLVPDILPRHQAELVLQFHRDWLTWMHNTVYYPVFNRECEKFWNEGYVEEKAWLAVYYSMLCVSYATFSIRSAFKHN
jgi:hypothetical protein